MRNSSAKVHESPFWENGKFIVPQESELWYATLWKWKWFFPLQIEKEKIAFVKKYEAEHGTITHWKSAEGNMHPIVDGRNKGDMAYYAWKAEKEKNAAA